MLYIKIRRFKFHSVRSKWPSTLGRRSLDVVMTSNR